MEFVPFIRGKEPSKKDAAVCVVWRTQPFA